MKSQTITLNRWFVAIAAAGCFVAAAIVAVRAPSEQLWWGGLLRAGVVLVALWLCLPTPSRPAAWADLKPTTAAILFGSLALAVIRPKLGLPLVALVLLLKYVFTPRRPKR